MPRFDNASNERRFRRANDDKINDDKLDSVGFGNEEILQQPWRRVIEHIVGQAAFAAHETLCKLESNSIEECNCDELKWQIALYVIMWMDRNWLYFWRIQIVVDTGLWKAYSIVDIGFFFYLYKCKRMIAIHQAERWYVECARTLFNQDRPLWPSNNKYY